MSLRALAEALQPLVERVETRPADYQRLLPGQDAFLREPRSPKLFRAGNQNLGKTTAGLREVICRALGEHPYLEVAPAPTTSWIVCASWPQSVEIQGKLWDLLPKDLLAEGQTFDRKRGFPGHSTSCALANGSIIRFKTSKQGTIDMAGGTVHCILFDEPPASERVFEECKKRILKQGSWGMLALTLTPINAPTDWLKKQCEEGKIADHHFRLTPENLIPLGQPERFRRPLRLADGTPQDARFIRQLRLDTPDSEEGVVLDGEWELRETARTFSAFDESRHVTREPPTGTLQLLLGLDHGDGRNFSEAAYLVAVDDQPHWPRIHVLDEYVSEGTTSEVEDAQALIAMLARHGLHWRELDEVHGDQSHPGRRDGASKKSNEDLQIALRHLDPLATRPRIRSAKRGVGRGSGSVVLGIRFLHRSMVRDAFRVDERCVHLIKGLKRWKGADDEYKHQIDALRYALCTHIFKRERPTTPKIRVSGR